jgi:molybdopterin/thiamine biosynthesis adenylyltransferase
MKNRRIEVIFRMANPKSERLLELLTFRYPSKEWGTFVRLGFRETENGLILLLREIDPPAAGDLDTESSIVDIQSQYISRILRNTDNHAFGIGFIHSHPQAYWTSPSDLDLEMESYFANLFNPYTPQRPFASLIFAFDSEKNLSATGRVFWKNKWYEISRFIIESRHAAIESYKRPSFLDKQTLKTVNRLVSQFSIESANELAGATVGIVGASGTGSPCIELLARAGVGKLIIVDPEVFEESNLERIHGSFYKDISTKIPKVTIAGRHVNSINPKCKLTLIKGRIPQALVVNRLLECDLVLGCSDLQSARVALSDLAIRYLTPVIDIGVVMEGKNGILTGQVIQINRLFASDPCVYCREMINSLIVHQELMPLDEQDRRKAQAVKAKKDGNNPNLYWLDMPQLNTVGYLTTTAAGIAVSYVIGYLTGRYKMNKNRLEINLSREGVQVVETNVRIDEECRCRFNDGASDQDMMAVMITSPSHWASPTLLEKA